VGENFNYELERSEAGDRIQTPSETRNLLTARNLGKAGAFKGIDLELGEGEILGLAGLRGSGRTELLKAIAGIDPPDEGEITVAGVPMRLSTPLLARQNGVVYLPEDRDNEGLIEILSVRNNLTLSSLKRLTKGALIDKRAESRVTEDLIGLLSIATPSPEQEARYLSGGNRQKVVVGKILASEPKVFLLDEPTKGIDIPTKKGILGIIRDELTRSSGVILTSPGLEDLILVCDRILVLYEGEIVRAFEKEAFQENRIHLAMQGVLSDSDLGKGVLKN
jgi:ABC-type sugar transport system ATPase subunit